MEYRDAIYGAVDIREPVVLDIMASSAMARLKEVSQHGITALLGITPPFSRFDHCIGTMLLVRRLGGGLEEQLAALVHDISHTAFSHVIDFVFDDHDGQSYHEKHKQRFVAASDIPGIMTRHGMDWHAIMDENKFPLLEQPSPALCADRLDYFFRDLEFLGLATSAEIGRAVESIEVRDGRIVVTDTAPARWLAYTYIETDRASWSNFREVGLYQLTAEAIKTATSLSIVDEADFWGTDQHLWGKLRGADVPQLRRLVNMISPGTRFTWDEDNPMFRITTKVRSIDPPVNRGGEVHPLSSLDADFGRFRDDYLAGKHGHWPMGVVPAPVK